MVYHGIIRDFKGRRVANTFIFNPREVIAYADDLTLICLGTSPSEAASKAECLIATVST